MARPTSIDNKISFTEVEVAMNVITPKVTWLTINRECNNRCSWCYAKKANHEHVELSDAKRCIDRLCELGIKKIILIGGEPTVYQYLLDIVSYIVKKGLKVSLLSNGRCFSDYSYAKRCIETGVSGIDISLKGINRSEYIENTGADGFEESLLGYHNLKKLNYCPTLSYVVCDGGKIQDLLDLLVTENLDNITLLFEKPIIQENSKTEMSITDMGKTVSTIYELFEPSSKHYRIEVSFPLCVIEKSIRDALIQKERINTCCHIQRGIGLVLDTRFRALPCNHFVDLPYSDVPVGLLSKSEIVEYWNSEQVEGIRSKTRFFPSMKCENCHLWIFCGGGCFVRWLFEDPTQYISGLN